MFCKHCGAECEEGAKTCPSCGKEFSTPTPETAAEKAESKIDSAAIKDAASKLGNLAAQAGNGKNKKLFLIAGVAVVALIAVFAIGSALLKPPAVSVDQLKSDLALFDEINEGFVSQLYTEETAYTIDELEIDELEPMKNAAGVTDYANVEFHGKISNGNFESTFTGYVGYLIIDKEQGPSLAGEPVFDSVETKPLKGVSKFDFYDGSDDVKISDFESTFEEKDGVYTSVASQSAEQEFWFATDTAKGTQNFVFDAEEGWVTDGDPEISDQKTEWKLSGRSFSANLTNDDLKWSNGPGGSLTSSISLGEIGKDGAVSAEYRILFTPEAYSDNYTWTNVDLTGTATGHAVHEFGADDFTFELNDPANSVTLNCNAGDEVTKAGVGDVHTMDVGIITASVYKTFNMSGNTDEYEASGMTYLLDSKSTADPEKGDDSAEPEKSDSDEDSDKKSSDEGTDKESSIEGSDKDADKDTSEQE